MPKFIRPWCRHFQRNDFPDGHESECDARFALLGEAPGRVEDEDQYGRPFIGPSGYDWERWIEPTGLRRNDFYIDNCYPMRPPDNKLFFINKTALVTSTQAALLRLSKLRSCNVVMPTGNTALRAMFRDDRRNITDWRGSILGWEGRKCIPTIHPAATQRQKVLTKLCVADWARIAEEGKFPDVRLPTRRHIIDPSEEELGEFVSGLRRYFEGPPSDLPRTLSIDVENDRKTHQLTCVGFSFDPLLSITVSTSRRDYPDDESFERNQLFIQSLLASLYPTVYQNGFTDVYKLSMHWPQLRGVICDNYTWDLMELAHMLDPNDGGDTSEGSEEETDEGLRVGMMDLATLTSLYTKEPYYKWMSSSSNWEVRQRYNGLDACVQREIFDVLWEKANERGLV